MSSFEKEDPTPKAVFLPAFGALGPLLQDETISEIMVNDVRNVIVEKNGQLSFTGLTLSSKQDLQKLVKTILDSANASLTPERPYVDAMLPDGSRVNIIAPPLTLNGPCITIRKFPHRALTLENLLANATLDKKMAEFLKTCVLARLNILVSGGTSSGKTTLLNALLGLVPANDRVVTIEDTPELVLSQLNSVRMQTRPEGLHQPPVTARDLVANSLRMRPDRIIVGECRRGEAFDMLQAMNTGHSGSMTSIHANSQRAALSRLETLCLMTGLDLPLLAIRKQIVGALDLIIQIKRFRDGSRKIVGISEVSGMEGDTITTQDIFLLASPAKDKSGVGQFQATGFVPSFAESIGELGLSFPPGFFS